MGRPVGGGGARRDERMFAHLLRRLVESGAVVVGVDLLLTGVADPEFAVAVEDPVVDAEQRRPHSLQSGRLP
ncbi:hypothetical protein QM583_08115 [Gordonia alkanivorans]|uniref:hypothetical protein n=1 Tax=Gordonia alkanivorans TaxID=84096 RepID=UPI0024B6AA60|nr:hypothetical protein [Gordonia alkanivorans]MDJ0027054.1 hypothetical protein [Gordonia alkanivorans]